MSSVSRHISPCHGWPPELSDYLIDHVWDSKPTLSSCSLVCRTWVRRSRHHLFQEVNISVKRSPKLDVFLAFLDSSPHLSSSIRRLTLHGTVADDKLGYAVWFYVSSETLLNCLDKLPHLAELSLRGIRLTENIGVGGGPTIATSFHHRRPVQRLLLSNVFVHPDRLFHILHFFPRLLSLVAEAIYWTLDNEPPSSDVHCLASPPLPMLESVTLGAESSYQMPVYFFPRLQRSIDITAMRCLTLHFDRLDTCPQITNFMDCAGPQLQTLRIIIGKRARVTAVDSFVDSLKLQRCSALAEFGFTLDATYSRSKDPSAAWSLLHSVVVKLPNNVRRLTITHRLDYDTLHVGLCDWNWSALDAELSNKGLSSVVIHSPAHNSDTRINATHMRDGAGACHSRIEPSEVFFRTSLPTLSKSHSLSFNS